jgi:hypothetical protein
MGADRGTVAVECFSYVTRFVGGRGSGRIQFDEPLEPGDTVRTVLRRVSTRHPQLAQALWDGRTGELGEHIEVVVNDAVLDITHTLDSELLPGDRITLVGQYIGGEPQPQLEGDQDLH